MEFYTCDIVELSKHAHTNMHAQTHIQAYATVNNFTQQYSTQNLSFSMILAETEKKTQIFWINFSITKGKVK